MTPTPAERRGAPAGRRRQATATHAKPAAAGLTADVERRPGAGQARSAPIGMPVYYPKLIVVGLALLLERRNCDDVPDSRRRVRGSYPRAYLLHDRQRHRPRAYRMTLVINPVARRVLRGAGDDLAEPADPQQPDARRETVNGKQLMLYANGGKLSLVAWRTPHGRLLDLEHADRHHRQPADGRDRRVADAGGGTGGVPPYRDAAATACTLGRSMSSATRTDRGDRHRLRRAGDRGRVRRARQRGLVRRHRRRQDRPARARRDPDLRARPGRVGGAPTASGCTSRPSSRRRSSTPACCSSRSARRRRTPGDADLSAVNAVVDAMPRVGPARAGDEVDGAGRHRRRDQADASPSRARTGSRTSRARSSSRRARRSRTSCSPTGSSSATTATGPATPCRALRAARRAARADRHRQRRDDQARRERVPGHQDLVHQRDRQRLRGDRRRRARGGARDGPRPADRHAFPEAGYRLRRLVVFPRMSPRSSSSPATRATTSSC